MSAFTIRKITVSECYPLRQQVLRPGHPPEASIFPEDEIPGTFHLGAIASDETVVGIASFSPQTDPRIASEKSVRLRGMATHPEFQKKGIGAALLKRAFSEIQTQGFDLIWCHARTAAREFYEKLGLKIQGEEFLNPIGIPHFVMTRKLPSLLGSTVDVNFENFEEIVDTYPRVILDFWAEWCQPCRVFSPIFEKMAVLNPDVLFGKVNSEVATELAQAFNIRSIPTVMAFKNSELLFEQAGLLPPEMFEALLNKLREDD